MKKKALSIEEARRASIRNTFYAILLPIIFFLALCITSYAFAVGAIPVY